jgi:hypothetical protein
MAMGVERSIIGGGGSSYSYIRVLHHLLLLKLIVFTVCEHEYMNMSPPKKTPKNNIDLPTPMAMQTEISKFNKYASRLPIAKTDT